MPAALFTLSKPLVPRTKNVLLISQWNSLGPKGMRSQGLGSQGVGAETHVARDTDQESRPVIIKKYANRRLYNTDTSTYVTLEDLAEMVRSERDFVVFDAKTGGELTHAVLTQIIVEQENRGQNLLPIGFLRQLIRFYGDSIQKLVPSYLEFSLDTLTREQERYRHRFAHTFGTAAFEAMQEQVRKNFATFERALGLFSPFSNVDSGDGKNDHAGSGEGSAERSEAPSNKPSDDDIATLQAELSAMQERLDQLSRRSD
jgi:polyhydroxyalkanoate synthesis repressor PhaR